MAPGFKCLEITRKKLTNDEAHGSISVDSSRVWKDDLAMSNASFFSSSLPSVYAHAGGKDRRREYYVSERMAFVTPTQVIFMHSKHTI